MLLLRHEQNEKVPPRQRGRRTPYANAVAPIPCGFRYGRHRTRTFDMRCEPKLGTRNVLRAFVPLCRQSDGG